MALVCCPRPGLAIKFKDVTDYFIRKSGSQEISSALIFEAGRNLVSGERDFIEQFGVMTSLEEDLLLLGSAVFAADRATVRDHGENFQRTISLELPVKNYARLHPLVNAIEKVLRKLSDDRWIIKFRIDGGAQSPDGTFPQKGGRTLLFSGGLDSLAAAVQFGKSDVPLHLVSHRTKNPFTETAQRELVNALEGAGYQLTHTKFFVSSSAAPPGNLDHDAEGTQRTRSFLFLILAALASRRLGSSTILMLAENGQLAIHLPLTSGRIGALSTHTAHPDVLALMESILSAALLYSVKIQNPYLYRTKAEVIAPVIASLPGTIAVSTSCWKNARLTRPATHCGACIPCFIRRIAIEVHAKDPTAYEEDVWSQRIGDLPETHEGRRNLVDLGEFIRQFDQSSEPDLMVTFPELYSENLNGHDAIAMYKRFAAEAKKVLTRYPGLAPIL